MYSRVAQRGGSRLRTREELGGSGIAPPLHHAAGRLIFASMNSGGGCLTPNVVRELSPTLNIEVHV